jgi:hypothetical protein
MGRLSTEDQIRKIADFEKTRLSSVLENLCIKGLVVDIWIRDRYYYIPSPMVVGIFEFTMMRTGDDLKSKAWAKLFHSYIKTGAYKVNFGNGEDLNEVMPHENTIIVQTTQRCSIMRKLHRW